MTKTDIIGYQFAVLVEKGDASGFIAMCPGVGGVYEEGSTETAAVRNACRAACAILEARARKGDWLEHDSEHLKVMRRPTRGVCLGPVWKDPATAIGTCTLAASC